MGATPVPLSAITAKFCDDKIYSNFVWNIKQQDDIQAKHLLV
jgi:hypothetical protein